ncbi:MAG TPA: hypothetical protein VFW71_08115 [Actinomycetota bacterium]|nr:hypothetical protein [Actinomycetota bacterium]
MAERRTDPTPGTPTPSEEEVVDHLAEDEEHFTMPGDPDELHTDADPHRHDGADWNTPTV